MGRTHITAQLAAVIHNSQGLPYFLLAEESYESNVFPQTPSWCAVFFGGYESAMDRIIQSACSIEGGSLRGIAETPTGYIRAWRRHLANPHQLPRSCIVATVGPYLSDIPPSSLPAIAKACAQAGLAPPDPDAKTVQFDLSDDRALSALAGAVGGGIEGCYPWRLFNATSFLRHTPTLKGVQVVEASSAALGDVEVYSLGTSMARHGCQEEGHVLRVGNEWRLTGWQYSTVGAFLTSVVVKRERQTPGIAEALIRRFRALLRTKQYLPDSTPVCIQRPPAGEPSSAWRSEVYASIASSLGLAPEQAITASLAQIRAQDLVRKMESLSGLVTFGLDAHSATAGQQQLALLD